MFDSHCSEPHARGSHEDGGESTVKLSRQAESLAMHRTGYPLAMASDNERLVITAMHGGRRYRRQLMDMGLRPGLTIKVLRARGNGPVLITVGETRLGIGRGMAEKIEAVPEQEAAE